MPPFWLTLVACTPQPEPGATAFGRGEPAPLPARAAGSGCAPAAAAPCATHRVRAWPGLVEGVVPTRLGPRVSWAIEARPEGEGPVVLDLGPGAGRVQPEGVAVLDGGAAWSGLSAWDADGRAVPATFRFAGGRLRVEVDDRGARYPLTVDPLASTPALQFVVNGSYGGATAAGDVNGDGYGDVTVALGLYLGSATGLDPTLVDTASGTVAEAGGDVNGDGYADVVTTEPLGSATRVFYGTPSGYAAQVSTLNGGAGAAVGDVNGDGFDDVAALDLFVGTVEVYLGGAAGLAVAPAASMPLGGLASDVERGGDVNGDGFGDLLVYQADGVLRVYPGSPTGPAANRAQLVRGLYVSGGQSFGPTRGVGDVNGDPSRA